MTNIISETNNVNEENKIIQESVTQNPTIFTIHADPEKVKERVQEFAKVFEEEIFPIMYGENGEGLEKFRAYVERRKQEVAERRKLIEQQQMEQNIETISVVISDKPLYPTVIKKDK